MNVKAHALLTQHYTDARRLPADLLELLPRDVRDKRRLYPGDLDPALLAEVATRFRAGLAPPRTAGRLGLVLFQFPVWIPYGRETKALIASLRDLLPEDRITVEFRNATWKREDTRDATLALPRDHGLVYTCVDEPQGFVSSVPPIAAARAMSPACACTVETSRAKIPRTRRRASASNISTRARSSPRAWVPKVRRLADEAGEVHVVMHNCYSDYAVRNAGQMIALIEAAERREAAAA